jgi:diguanylate cyclase (GGDEF)-like protein
MWGSLERNRRDREAAAVELATARLACRTDVLTGLPNRLALDEELAARRVSDRPWSLVMLDLDKFKDVNDTFGHAVGDELLVEIARRLEVGAGEHGLAARLAGDEFALVLPFAAEVAAPLTRRVLDAVRQPMLLASGVRYQAGMSAGVVESDPDTTSAELKRRADLALYRAKVTRGQVVVWTTELAMPARPAVERRQGRADAVVAVPAWAGR